MELINDMTIQEQVVEKLKNKNYHISFAESCTGGLCCAKLVEVSSASAVLDMSFVTYANSAKVKLLGVDEDTISDFGVVSEEVARQMAFGVAKKAQSEIGVGVTGIAGPTGETENKPVGMVCFGIYVNGNVVSYTKYFGNIGRNNVREQSANFVYEVLNRII